MTKIAERGVQGPHKARDKNREGGYLHGPYKDVTHFIDDSYLGYNISQSSQENMI